MGEGWIKGTQAWDNFDFFFWPKSNPYMPFVNFRKKIRFFSFDFRQNFDVWTFPRWLSIRGTKCFWEISKFFFFKIFTLVLLYGFLGGFSSHAEHAWKCLKVEYLGRIEYDCQKPRVTGPWDHKVSVSAKKVKKNSCLCTFKGGKDWIGRVWRD